MCVVVKFFMRAREAVSVLQTFNVLLKILVPPSKAKLTAVFAWKMCAGDHNLPISCEISTMTCGVAGCPCDSLRPRGIVGPQFLQQQEHRNEEGLQCAQCVYLAS